MISEGYPVYHDKINGHFPWDVPEAHMCNPGCPCLDDTNVDDELEAMRRKKKKNKQTFSSKNILQILPSTTFARSQTSYPSNTVMPNVFKSKSILWRIFSPTGKTNRHTDQSHLKTLCPIPSYCFWPTLRAKTLWSCSQLANQKRQCSESNFPPTWKENRSSR